MKNVTRVLLIDFVFLIVLTSTSSILANPIVIQTTIDPARPLPISTITFNTAILVNETIDEVQLLVQECRDGLCFIQDFNISMEKTANETYHAQCTLIQEEATQLKYRVAIKNNETWFYTEPTIVNLTTHENNNFPQNNSHNNLTSGFELLLLFFSIGFLMMIQHYKLKKNKSK